MKNEYFITFCKFVRIFLNFQIGFYNFFKKRHHGPYKLSKFKNLSLNCLVFWNLAAPLFEISNLSQNLLYSNFQLTSHYTFVSKNKLIFIKIAQKGLKLRI